MAERIVSPGVFTNEVDQSFLAGGVAQIGAAIVGPTVKGPALVPTQITSYGDFEQIFGSYSDETYIPFVVNDYLRNGNVITVTRLLYEDGYNIQNGALAIVAKSGSGASAVEAVTHLLHPTQAVLELEVLLMLIILKLLRLVILNQDHLVLLSEDHLLQIQAYQVLVHLLLVMLV